MLKTLLILLSFSFIMHKSQNKIIDGQQSQPTFKVMTYNIKYDDKNDSVNNWDARKDDVVGLIKYHAPELLGTQEGLQHQLDYIEKNLSRYEYVGIGRDGDDKSEYSAILYDTTKFNLINSNTFWLSENRKKREKSWDAAFPRICTWGEFQHKRTGQVILYFNTHFDHKGETARYESTKLIIQKIKALKSANHSASVILTGDFNFTPEAEPYKLLTQHFSDTQQQTSHYGPQETFNGFHFDKIPDRRIDYIFIQEGLEVLQHATLSDSKNMKYPSDHFPVIAELEIKK